MVRAEIGNARRFMCPYHGWTYANDGTLAYVPGEQEAYYGELEKGCLGLVEARVDVCRHRLRHLGSQRPHPGGVPGRCPLVSRYSLQSPRLRNEALGPIKWLEPVNWKTPVDNCSDNYHVPTSHRSSMVAQARHLGRPRLSHQQQFQAPHKHLFINGHALTVRILQREDEARQFHGVSQANRHLFEEYYRATLPEAERRLGSFRARRVNLGNHSLFPHGVLGFRLAHPPGAVADGVLAFRVPREGHAARPQTSAAYGTR